MSLLLLFGGGAAPAYDPATTVPAFSDSSGQQDRSITQRWFAPEPLADPVWHFAAAPSLVSLTWQGPGDVGVTGMSWALAKADPPGIYRLHATSTVQIVFQFRLDGTSWDATSGGLDPELATPVNVRLTPTNQPHSIQVMLAAAAFSTQITVPDTAINAAQPSISGAPIFGGYSGYGVLSASQVVPYVDGLWQDQSGQQDRSLTQRWFAPEETAWTPQPLVGGLYPLTGLHDQPADWRPTRWFAPEASAEGFVPIPDATFDPATLPSGDQPADWRPTVWFAPDDDYLIRVEGLTPTVAQLSALWWHDASAQQDRSIQATWFQPDTEAWTPIPTLTVATVDQQSGLWQDGSGQQDRSIQATWSDPLAWSSEGFVPIGPAFDQSLGNWQEQPGQERGNDQRWFTPDLDTLGITPFGFTTATVVEQAGLWQDGSGQQDRSITQRWFTPDDDYLAPFQSPVAPFDPSTIISGNSFEAVVVWRQWFSPDMFEAHFAGTLQEWLMLTWDLTPRGGTVPKVLIDADSGEPFIYLAGPFIVRAD